MYGPKVSSATTLIGGAGAAVLPNTGNTSPLFYTAAVLFVCGLVALAVSGIVSLKTR